MDNLSLTNQKCQLCNEYLGTQVVYHLLLKNTFCNTFYGRKRTTTNKNQLLSSVNQFSMVKSKETSMSKTISKKFQVGEITLVGCKHAQFYKKICFLCFFLKDVAMDLTNQYKGRRWDTMFHNKASYYLSTHQPLRTLM